MLAGNILREKGSQVKPAFRDKLASMHEIDMTADELVSALLNLASGESVCILDSCGIGHLGSHLLIAGLEPVETIEITNDSCAETLRVLDETLTGGSAAIFTISYDFGLKLLGIDTRKTPFSSHPETDVFLSRFDTLIIHDYNAGATSIAGNPEKFELIQQKLTANIGVRKRHFPETIFERLRRDHPAPFSAFIKRVDSTVVSASPERFFCVDHHHRTITTSPIKGTRRRGETAEEDETLRQELLTSTKDRAENTMIVDLLRNDLGRVCEYGSVRVEKLCDLEEYPTLFHFVSTVSGDLHRDSKFSDILKAVFPCGSITGAPKISTMGIIEEIETADRGLSMGAIGYYIPNPKSQVPVLTLGLGLGTWDLNVAIRTMVIRDNTATFNIGGGIVIDSDPESEYEETLTKAKALLSAINGKFE